MTKEEVKHWSIVGVLSTSIVVIFTVCFLYLINAPTSVDSYNEIDPHRIQCVDGTTLQADGSCADQEN